MNAWVIATCDCVGWEVGEEVGVLGSFDVEGGAMGGCCHLHIGVGG